MHSGTGCENVRRNSQTGVKQPYGISQREQMGLITETNNRNNNRSSQTEIKEVCIETGADSKRNSETLVKQVFEHSETNNRSSNGNLDPDVEHFNRDTPTYMNVFNCGPGTHLKPKNCKVEKRKTTAGSQEVSDKRIKDNVNNLGKKVDTLERDMGRLDETFVCKEEIDEIKTRVSTLERQQAAGLIKLCSSCNNSQCPQGGGTEPKEGCCISTQNSEDCPETMMRSKPTLSHRRARQMNECVNFLQESCKQKLPDQWRAHQMNECAVFNKLIFQIQKKGPEVEE